MKTIYKFTIPKEPCRFTLELPAGYTTLSLKQQDENLVMYVLGDFNDQKYTNKFILAYTGEEIDTDFEPIFIGTVIHTNGLVYHLFEML